MRETTNLTGRLSLTRGDGAESRVRPGEELAAEAGADEAGDDLDVLRREAEDRGHDIVVVDDALGALVEGDARAMPDGGGGVHLHGVVGFDRGAVDGVDLDRSGGKGGIGVAALALDVRASGGSDGGQRVGEIGGDVGLGGVVLDANGGGSGVGLGKGVGYDDGDVLAPVADGVVGERRTVFAAVSAGAGAIDALDVVVGEDEEDAGKFLGGRGVDGADGAVGDGGADGNGVGHVREVVVAGVASGAGGLELAVDARDRGADDGGGVGDGFGGLGRFDGGLGVVDEGDVFAEVHEYLR